MQRILQELTALHKTENAKVALRARQVNVYIVLLLICVISSAYDFVCDWRCTRVCS